MCFLYINESFCVLIVPFNCVKVEGNTACLTIHFIITPFDPLKYHVFENIMENGAFALF